MLVNFALCLHLEYITVLTLVLKTQPRFSFVGNTPTLLFTLLLAVEYSHVPVYFVHLSRVMSNYTDLQVESFAHA